MMLNMVSWMTCKNKKKKVRFIFLTLMFQEVQQTVQGRQTGSFLGPHRYHPKKTHQVKHVLKHTKTQ